MKTCGPRIRVKPFIYNVIRRINFLSTFYSFSQAAQENKKILEYLLSILENEPFKVTKLLHPKNSQAKKIVSAKVGLQF
jgi:hypothetical protein